MTKTNNFIVMNNKGGVGKSTFTQQILTTYNLINNNEAFIKELDDQNKDAKSLTASNVIAEQVKVISENNLREKITEYEIINPETKNTIIDVGGNITTDIFIKAIHASIEVLDFIDAIFIPVIDNGISVDNAKNVYNDLTNNGELKDVAAKVVFVINNMATWRFADAVKSEDIEELNSIAYKRYYDAIDYFNSVNAKWLPVLQMDGIENTKTAFNSTAVEIFNNMEELKEVATQAQRDAFKLKDKARKTAITNAARLKNMLYDVTLYVPPILFTHEILKDILSNIGNNKTEAEAV